MKAEDIDFITLEHMLEQLVDINPVDNADVYHAFAMNLGIAIAGLG